MAYPSSLGPELATQIGAIREFNRFYTARLGLLRKRHLDGEFSLTEGRLLYEIGASPATTAAVLCSSLQLDPGYISRLLTALTRRGLIRQTPSKVDARQKKLTLTAKGSKSVAKINQLSDRQLRDLLATLSASNRELLVSSLQSVRRILSGSQRPAARIERINTMTAEAADILEEYYEAVNVVKRDKPGSMQKMLHEPGAGMWLAYLGDQLAGCVVLRGLPAIPNAAECKRLYVKPSARGNRVGDLLLDALEDFARNHRFEWIYLDTHDGLKTAIALYQRRGYASCARYNDNPQATLFMRKRIA